LSRTHLAHGGVLMRISLSTAITLTSLAAAGVVASTIPATSQVARPLSGLAASANDDGLVIEVRGGRGGRGGGFRGGGGGARFAGGGVRGGGGIRHAGVGGGIRHAGVGGVGNRRANWNGNRWNGNNNWNGNGWGWGAAAAGVAVGTAVGYGAYGSTYGYPAYGYGYPAYGYGYDCVTYGGCTRD
jgi:hypothetical protein